MRADYQKAIRPTFVAAVERMTGRTVIGLISGTHIERSFTFEYFELETARTATTGS